MNLLKKLLSLVSPNKCTAELRAELFEKVLRAKNVRMKEIAKVNGVALFVEWYDGPCTEEDILAAIPEFLNGHGAVRAKTEERFK